MRFIMFLIPNDARAEAGGRPGPEHAARMRAYDEQLTRAGVLIARDGLQPSSRGLRISFSGGRPQITEGPFTDAREIIGGYWILQTRSRAEAIEWARRVPAEPHHVIELRAIFEMEDGAA